MTQLAPTVLLYGQALIMLKELNDAFAVGGLVNTNIDVTRKIQEILTRYQAGAGGPITKWNPVVETEPPSSIKMNKFWGQVQSDIALMQHQLDVLRASTTFTFNYLTQEVQKAATQNAVAKNKVKTLQLYGDSVDSSIVLFSENFHNTDNVDNTQGTAQSLAHIETDGFLSLGRLGTQVNLATKAAVAILSTSNGFPGNNQEVEDPINAPISDPVSGERDLTFVAESKRAADVRLILDNKPTTWFEYEHWLVSDETRHLTKNFGFNYVINNSNGSTSVVDWGLGPDNGVLKLDLEFDLREASKINQVTYTPFGLTDNVNLPVKVALVEISPDGTTWTEVTPKNVWISSDVNIQTARIADTVVARKAIWNFQETLTRFVRIHIEQPNPIVRPLGHIYWYNSKVATVEQLPGGFKRTTYAPLGLRVDGPTPVLNRINEYYGPTNAKYGGLIQLREWFNDKRWAIGIRDVTFEQLRYYSESVMVTKPIRAGGVIDRVLLEADVYIPPDFSATGDWVQFFISPDNGTTWYRIARIQDDFLSIPEVIAFNDPIPEAFQEPGVSYVETSGDVTSLRLKIVLKRPSTSPASTPIVRSYKLKMQRR